MVAVVTATDHSGGDYQETEDQMREHNIAMHLKRVDEMSRRMETMQAHAQRAEARVNILEQEKAKWLEAEKKYKTQADGFADDGIPVDCGKYAEGSKIAQCAASERAQQLIGPVENYLFKAMEKDPAFKRSYYSCGLETGDRNKLLCRPHTNLTVNGVLSLACQGGRKKPVRYCTGMRPLNLVSFTQ